MRTRKILKSTLRKTRPTAITRRRRTAAETLRRIARARACCRPGRRQRTRTRRSVSSSAAAAAAKLVSNGEVSDKLEALKNLIPGSSHFKNGDVEENHDQTIKTEQLFQETADYIILLRTRVVVLQRLIEFYGSATTTTTATTCRENQNDNHVNVLL